MSTLHTRLKAANTRNTSLISVQPQDTAALWRRIHFLVLTNRVAACCRRSANGSTGAEPRLATRRRRRRRRRTLEDCSNGPKAPRIHTESNAEGCVCDSSGRVWRGVFVLVAQDGDKGESVHSFFSLLFSLLLYVCIRCCSDTESQKSEGEKHGPESEPHT